jgi:sirohydrochlorin ferrochelatase
MLFLAPGFLSDRVTELALEAGAVAVAEPLGADSVVAEVILARYAVGAVELVPLEPVLSR